MIKFSNGNKLYRFITDGTTAKLQVDTSTYFPRDTEIALSESQQEALKDFIENKLLPPVFLNKYKKYINKKVIYYDRDGDCYVGYLAAIMPKDPEQPFAIYINYDGSPVEPERSSDLFFSSRIEPLKDGE